MPAHLPIHAQAHVRRVLLDSFADCQHLGGTFPALAALEVEDARFNTADLAHVASLRHLRSLKLLVRSQVNSLLLASLLSALHREPVHSL